jgi:LEA14-like dessication related protein
MKRIIYLLALSTLLFSCVSLNGCIHQVRFGKPEIRNISYEWGELTNSTTEIITNVTVFNPNPIPLPLKDVRTEVYLGDIKMGEGSALQSEIKPNSESTVVISTKLENSKVPQWWVSHIQNNEESLLKITGNLIFDLKLTDFKYPFEFSSPIETNILAELNSAQPQETEAGPVSLTIKSIESHWGNINKGYTEIMSAVLIRNDNPYPIPVTKFNYSIVMNGIAIAEGSSDISTTILPTHEETLSLTTKLDNGMLVDWWVSHIEAGEKTQGKITIKPVIEYLGEEFQFTLIEEEFEFITNLLG